MNIGRIMTSPSNQEGFLKDADDLRNLFKTTGWKIYIRMTEELIESESAGLERSDPDKPGAIGKMQGTILALKQSLKFEASINSTVDKIRASHKDPSEEKDE